MLPALFFPMTLLSVFVEQDSLEMVSSAVVSLLMLWDTVLINIRCEASTPQNVNDLYHNVNVVMLRVIA